MASRSARFDNTTLSYWPTPEEERNHGHQQQAAGSRLAAAVPLLFATVSGAHLYGFPSPDSDYDLRGVHLLPARDLLGLHALKDTIDSTGVRDGLEIDLVTHDAGKFFGLLLKKNGYVLEQLLSPIVLHTTPEH